ncbi:Collagenase-like protease, PrtC family [Granulicatella balaenopterae]|uniref:Collagenase-like protease, PrtC family n=1 Tax=Granulicatella balaenopterae TaxID=137733 RepID=A0A1H9MIB6_9LACT|nr:peptidase U32 family protein [Granulicatella balaenopterae]SER23269.1 Collagenase-like protease, PrtC family [Granulicatella balaenopterae]
MTEIIATVESIPQAKALLEAGVDRLYFGEDEFGLRLPTSFSREEQAELTSLAHEYGKKVTVAVNAIFHNDRIEKLPEYLTFLKSIDVDVISVGDPGVMQVMKQEEYNIPFNYDAQVIVTSSKHINFWAKRGAVSAVVAREVPRESMKILAKNATIPVEVLVYGATCIHQSKRPLLQNYFNYIEREESPAKQRELFISEPQKDDSHYGIYQDINGTHIFASDDVLLAEYLHELAEMGVEQWKLDGIFSPGENFVKIARLFVDARDKINAGTWDSNQGFLLAQKIRQLHPEVRTLDPGFYVLNPEDVK